MFTEVVLRTLREGLDATSDTEFSINPSVYSLLPLKSQIYDSHTHFFLVFFLILSLSTLSGDLISSVCILIFYLFTKQKLSLLDTTLHRKMREKGLVRIVA